jgi:hypothetical protein
VKSCAAATGGATVGAGPGVMAADEAVAGGRVAADAAEDCGCAGMGALAWPATRAETAVGAPPLTETFIASTLSPGIAVARIIATVTGAAATLTALAGRAVARAALAGAAGTLVALTRMAGAGEGAIEAGGAVAIEAGGAVAIATEGVGAADTLTPARRTVATG